MSKVNQNQKSHISTWTEEEVSAVSKALTNELGVLTKTIALGDVVGTKRICSRVWSIIAKVTEAKRMGVTQANPPSNLEMLSPIVQDLKPLTEFAKSSRVIVERIYARLREYLSDFGVEDKFLVKVALPEERRIKSHKNG